MQERVVFMKGKIFIKFKFERDCYKDNWALVDSINAGINRSAKEQGFRFVGSGYDFLTHIRDLEFE